jgi:prepilin-type N-terminal cleavage/methylation domain-containing protein
VSPDPTQRAHRGFTLVETVVALAVAAVVVAGAMAGVRYFARPAGRGDVTLDQLAELSLGAENLDRDVRQARQIIYPAPGAAATRVLYLRDFEGAVVCYYFNPTARQLRRARFDLAGLPSEPRRAPASDLDGAYFSVNPNGLVSWALFAPSRMVMGSVRRVNQ